MGVSWWHHGHCASLGTDAAVPANSLTSFRRRNGGDLSIIVYLISPPLITPDNGEIEQVHCNCKSFSDIFSQRKVAMWTCISYPHPSVDGNFSRLSAGHPFDAEQSAYESEEEEDLIILLLWWWPASAFKFPFGKTHTVNNAWSVFSCSSAELCGSGSHWGEPFNWHWFINADDSLYHHRSGIPTNPSSQAQWRSSPKPNAKLPVDSRDHKKSYPSA